MRIVKQSVMVAPNKLTSTNMEKIPKLSITVILLSIVLAGCNDSITGDQIDLSSLQKQFRGITAPKALDKPRAVSDMIPLSRDELSSLRTVVKVCNGEHNAGITVPGFGGVRLGKNETNLNVYYVETKLVKTGTDTVVYGIGYSTHYLFKKLKKGIDVSNLGQCGCFGPTGKQQDLGLLQPANIWCKIDRVGRLLQAAGEQQL